MYGWTDPNDPDAAYRRPQPSADDPAWLTDRPEPRSAYLFGDGPVQDGPVQPDSGAVDASARHFEDTPDRWVDPSGPTPSASPGEPWAGVPRGQHPTEPTGQWRHEQAGQWSAGPTDQWRDEPTGQWTGGQTGSWQGEQAGQWQDEQAGSWQGEQTGSWQGEQAGPQAYRAAAVPVPADLDRDATALTPAVVPVGGRPVATDRTRSRRRSKRPLLIGGAAAAATLVVSLGIGALLLPDDDGPADRAALDEPVATAPVIPDAAPSATTAAPASPSASPSPSTVSPSPSPSRTATPTPTPSRTQAASRQTTRGGAIPTAATTTRAAVSGGGGSQTQQVVDLVNAERAKAGCAAVTVDDKLTLAAQRHSQDQADHESMTHTGSDGSNAGQRLDRAGYTWRTYGENVAWNQQTPAAVMAAWMNSSGHRANILNCAFTEIGVGVASSNGPYWTQDFAAPR
ncbi:CAP domain-containing protein [Micromonospora sp. NBC_00421]|uniref:CAP domain-containing protein n=1 Tax=Micromonospora sp. NBC_00421 TaxID=2975976 RepID=UPI002E1E4242